MIDPFRPLMLTEDAVNIEDDSYHKSWQINVE
jgi:homogentisate 1,2-dioxygenase